MGAHFTRGSVIAGRYTLKQLLGEGGCAEVWYCLDNQTQHRYAIKIVTDGDFKRFQREVLIMREVTDPHVVACIDGGREGNVCYSVMEIIDGGSLEDLRNSGRTFKVEQALWIILQAVRGLKATKVIHRDIKPANLMIKKGNQGDGFQSIVGDLNGGCTVKVADFGLAKHAEDKQGLTHTQEIMGTPTYMSPEQCRSTKSATVESDIYSLGIVLYQLLVGSVPFMGQNPYETIRMQIEKAPAYPSWFPAKARTIVEKCLQKNPHDRYRSLVAFEHQLESVLGLSKPSFWASLFGAKAKAAS